MSTRYNSGSHYENLHQASELHDLTEHENSAAAAQHGKQDHKTGNERTWQALEHSHEAHQQTGQTRQKTTNEHGIVTFGHAEIAALAYELWEARGRPEGSSEEDWFRAAEKLRLRR